MAPVSPPPAFRCILFDWGGTLMSEEGPLDIPMALWPEVRAIDGARETLEALAATHRLGIATNASVSRRPMIEQALGRVGLREYITDIFCFTEIGARKETPEFWSHVLATLRMRNTEVAMIGDSLGPDVLAPRASGLYSVWFNEDARQVVAAPAVPMIEKLPQVVPLVRPGSRVLYQPK